MALLEALCTAVALGAASGFVVPGGRRVTTVTPPRHHPHHSPTTPVPSVLGLGLGRRSAGLVTLDGRKTGNTDRANKRSSSRRGSSKKKAPSSSSSTSGADRAGGDEEEDAWGLGLEEGDEVEEVIMAMDADGEADEEEEVEEWELNGGSRVAVALCRPFCPTLPAPFCPTLPRPTSPHRTPPNLTRGPHDDHTRE